MDNHQKIVRCIIANIRRVVVLVNFQDKLLQYKLPDYILVSILRVAIWNVTVKQVTLISSTQISRDKMFIKLSWVNENIQGEIEDFDLY